MKWDIKITKNSQTKLANTDFNNLPFGKVFTDHMFIADFADGKWSDCRIVPFDNISLHPATFALHYGQSIFEGIKAERASNGDIIIFRPEENAKRFAKSAERMALPIVPEELFLQAIDTLIRLDEKWVTENVSLYIRPFLFGVDPFLGVKIGETYKFMVIIGPTGPYYSEPVKVLIQDNFVRAFPGGTGEAKFAGNYAATLLPAKEAKEKGCSQILWTDGLEHKYLQEIGTMNVFVSINNVLITPDLSEGTILHGVTRKSLVVLAKEMGIKVEERKISVQEVLDAVADNTLDDLFGAGTAAVVSPIVGFDYKDKKYDLNQLSRNISKKLKIELEAIKSGKKEDKHGWIHVVE